MKYELNWGNPCLMSGNDSFFQLREGTTKIDVQAKLQKELHPYAGRDGVLYFRGRS